jgi:hypothetical protein
LRHKHFKLCNYVCTHTLIYPNILVRVVIVVLVAQSPQDKEQASLIKVPSYSVGQYLLILFDACEEFLVSQSHPRNSPLKKSWKTKDVLSSQINDGEALGASIVHLSQANWQL